MEDLSLLPTDHPLRNKPLIEIGAYYKAPHEKTWREVFPSFNIAKKTYNNLGLSWTANEIFKATLY
jgi:hypothetical protein